MSRFDQIGVEKPRSLTDALARLLERTQAVAQAAHFSSHLEAEEAAVLENAIDTVSRHAPLYFRFSIPSWPPHLLLRKVLRRVMLPFWMGQVHFNEASRDSFRGLARRTRQQTVRASEQQKQINDLKREIADLHSLVRRLSAGSRCAEETGAQGMDAAEGTLPPTEFQNRETSWGGLANRIAETLARHEETKTVSPLRFNDLDEEPSKPNAGEKPRVAFVAPFPPARTGVADYSEEILEPLSHHYDLDLYTENGYAPRLPAPFFANPLSSWEQNVHFRRRNYQSVIYQLGNNGHQHEDAYNLLMRYAGITVLHDYLLTNLMLYFCAECPHLPYTLASELAYEIGAKKAEPILRDLNGGKMSYGDFVASGIPMNRRVFTRSLGVVLHNEWSYKQAQKDRAGDNELITLVPPVIPPVTLGQTRDEIRALRQKWGVPVDAFVIAPCGIVTETKRPFATLDAFKKLLAERPDAFLLFVGSVSLLPGADFDAEIRKRGLAGRVKITGYVDVPTFNEYLLIADVCVTLRFPSQGETSGALLRMLVHGKPSIVTAVGSFDDFPNDTVHKLPTPGKMTDEVGEILDAFRLMASNREYREKVAASGLAYVSREHSPERCARLYAQFVDDVMKHPETRKKLVADWAGRDIARRSEAGSLTINELLAALEQSLFQAMPKPSVPTLA